MSLLVSFIQAKRRAVLLSEASDVSNVNAESGGSFGDRHLLAVNHDHWRRRERVLFKPKGWAVDSETPLQRSFGRSKQANGISEAHFNAVNDDVNPAFPRDNRTDIKAKVFSVDSVSPVDVLLLNAKKFGGFLSGDKLTVHSDQILPATVLELGTRRSPTPILGPSVGATMVAFAASVPKVVINAIKRHSARSLSRVGKVAFKAGFGSVTKPPSVADKNPSAAVVPIAVIRRVIAACKHAVIRAISRSTALAMRFDSFSKKTTTAYRGPGPDRIGGHNLFRSAFATAKPHNFAAAVRGGFIWRSLQDSQFPKLSADQIFRTAKAAAASFFANVKRSGLGKIKFSTITGAAPNSVIPDGSNKEINHEATKTSSGQIFEFRVFGGWGRDSILWTQIGHRGKLGSHGQSLRNWLCRVGVHSTDPHLGSIPLKNQYVVVNGGMP